MNIKQLIEKIAEIKRLAEDINVNDPISKDCLSKIIAICEDAEIDYKIEQRIEVNYSSPPESK